MQQNLARVLTEYYVGPEMIESFCSVESSAFSIRCKRKEFDSRNFRREEKTMPSIDMLASIKARKSRAAHFLSDLSDFWLILTDFL